MKCCKCQEEIPENSSFCPHCGCSQDDIEALRQGCIVDADECESAITKGEGSRPYIRKNFEKRLPEWKQAAELGVREAQWLLARCYDEAFGVERNEIQAISWHIKAAEQDYPVAQNHLGSCYQNGNGVPQDQSEALQWFFKAAEQGYTVAQSNLGWCYDTGSGVTQNETEAVKWYHKAALQNDETAQFNLGVHYEWGSGVAEDKVEAYKWYSKAAEQGYQKANEALKKLADEIAEARREKAEKVAEAELSFRTACKDALANGKITDEEKHQLDELANTLELSKDIVKKIVEDETKVFLRAYKQQQAKEAGIKFRIACKNAFADGKVTVDEKKNLNALGKSLKLSGEVMKLLFEDEKMIYLASQKVAPTRNIELQFRKACKKILADGKVTQDEKSQLKNLAKFFKMPNDAMKRILTDEVRIFRQSHTQKRST